MPNEVRAQSIALDEVNEVLKYWDIGLVTKIESMRGGSRQSPKVCIVAERGTFVLKRRPIHKADSERILFAHQVMLAAGAVGLPIPFVQVARNQSTFQFSERGVYELFLFLNGERWKRAPRQAHEAGRALATLHRGALKMQWHGHVKAACYHGNLLVVEALRRAPQAITSLDAQTQHAPLPDVCQQLSNLYQHASAQVEELDYQNMDSQVVHGDWHPGNILFNADQVSGVLDFDSARLEPAIADVANGLLQFSVRAGPISAIAKWPHELDESLFSGFTKGFAAVEAAGLHEFVNMVPWLMIEACIAEAAIPIARTGMFATIAGEKMLGLILRRAMWLQSNAANVARKISADIAR